METLTTSEALRILRLLDRVEWARISLGRDVVDGLMKTPLIVWRYAIASPDMAVEIRSVISDFDGHEEWLFESSRRNWAISPKRLSEKLKEWPSKSDSQAMVDIKIADQDYCRHANQDITRIFHEIERIVSS